MVCHDRGAALLNVLLILTVLLTLAHTLAEAVWESSRQAAAAARRDRAYWAAHAGIELARQRLASEYAASGGWQNLLADGVAGRYPETPAWTVDRDGQTVSIHLRDNSDGDNDPRQDNDLRIFVLSRVEALHGGDVLIETLCGLTAPDGIRSYRQAGHSGGDELDPVNLPVSTFGIRP